jgi:hypothetical protein
MTTAHKPALRTVTTLKALLFTPLFLAATASAQPCPNGAAHGGFPDGTGTVYLDFSGFPNPDAVYQGGDFWNNAQLAYGQGSWPTFQTTNGSVPNHVQIIYRDGLAVNSDGSPLRAPNGDRPPASFDPWSDPLFSRHVSLCIAGRETPLAKEIREPSGERAGCNPGSSQAVAG